MHERDISSERPFDITPGACRCDPPRNLTHISYFEEDDGARRCFACGRRREGRPESHPA